MNVEYFGHHFHVNDELRGFTEGKLNKLTRFVEEPIDVRVTLASERHRIVAELHVTYRHGILQATEEHDEVKDAINLAVDKVESQARRSKTKFLTKKRRADHKTHQSLRWPVNVLDGDTVGGSREPKVVKSSHFDIKPMTIDEAALELQGSKNEFVVFRDSSSDRINVLYRRKDQNFGLITPEL
jgi:putative sigma-54 modulation protein